MLLYELYHMKKKNIAEIFCLTPCPFRDLIFCSDNIFWPNDNHACNQSDFLVIHYHEFKVGTMRNYLGISFSVHTV